MATLLLTIFRRMPRSVGERSALAAAAIALLERAKRVGLLASRVSTRALQRLYHSSHALSVSSIRDVVQDVLDTAN